MALTAVAAPAALGLETALRRSILPPEMEDLRALLEEVMTPVGWGLAVVATAVAAAGLPLLSALRRKRLARLKPDAPADARARAGIAAFLIAASVVQVPAIVATFAFMLGSRFLPVGLAVGVSTLGVVLQALRTRAPES